MDPAVLSNSEIYPLLILPFLIFVARVLDVSLDTIRIIFISKGFRYIATVVGFFEVIIWLLAIGQFLQHMTNVLYYIAYAGGFAVGTFVGIYIENKLSLGVVVVQVITNREASDLVDFLKSSSYIVTSVDAEGLRGDVKLIYIIIDRKDIGEVAGIVKKFHPNAFYSIENVGFVSERIFRHKKSWYKEHHLDVSRFRKQIFPLKSQFKNNVFDIFRSGRKGR